MARRKKTVIKNPSALKSAPEESKPIETSVEIPTLNSPLLADLGKQKKINLEKQDGDSAVDLEIEQHKINEPGEPQRPGVFRSFLEDAMREDTTPEEVSQKLAESRGQRREKRPTQDALDVSNLTVSIITFAVASLNMPEDLKPDDDEIDKIAYHSTSIFLRHFPLKNKLSRDSIDAIAIVMVASSWYRRVSPQLRAYQAEQNRQRQAAAAQGQEQIRSRYRGQQPTPPAAKEADKKNFEHGGIIATMDPLTPHNGEAAA